MGAAFGAVTVLMTLAGWSAVPLFLRHFSHSIDAWTSNGWRYGFSALIWLPVVLIAKWRGRTPSGLWAMALVPSLFNAIGQVCFTGAHYMIPPGLLTFGLRVQVIFVAIGAYLMFPGERRVVRSHSFIAGFIMVLIGTMGAGLLVNDPFAPERLGGLGLAILSGAFFAAYGLSVRKYMRGVNSVIAFAAISQYTAAAMVALMFLFGDNFGAGALRLSTEQFSLLLLSAVIGIALGHVFYYASIARIGVAVTAGVLQLQPFVVGIASLAIFGEQLTGLQWVGGATAVVGALLMLNAQRTFSKLDRIERRAREMRRAAEQPEPTAAAPAPLKACCLSGPAD